MNSQNRQLTRWLRLLTSTTLILLSLATGSNGYTQSKTTCEPDKRCFSRAEVRAVADAACAVDRMKAQSANILVRELETADEQLGICSGRLLELRENPPAAPKFAPLWLRLALDVSIGGLAASTGALAGVGGPPEAMVGFAVASVAALLARIVLEVVTWE